jgi:hypothetical protein
MPTLARSLNISPRPISDWNLLARCPRPNRRVGSRRAQAVLIFSALMPEQPIHSSVRVAEKDSLRVDDAHEVVVFALMEMTDGRSIAASSGILGNFYRPQPMAVRKAACLPAVASYESMLMHEVPVQNPMEIVRGTAKFPISNKLYPSAFSHTKWAQNRLKARMRRNIERFPPKSRSGLPYQACPIPRIVRPSDMPVCGDRQFVYRFLIPRRRRDG